MWHRRLHDEFTPAHTHHTTGQGLCGPAVVNRRRNLMSEVYRMGFAVREHKYALSSSSFQHFRSSLARMHTRMDVLGGGEEGVTRMAVWAPPRM